jgi:hypothetical protein
MPAMLTMHGTKFIVSRRCSPEVSAQEAGRLHVSQPSQGLRGEVRELEDRLGLVLFDRLPRGVRLTTCRVVSLRRFNAFRRRASSGS